MYLDKTEMKLRYYNDAKEKHQSHEFHIDGLSDNLDNIYASGFGSNKDDAALDTINNIYELVSHLEGVIKQLNNIQAELIMGKYKDLKSEF